MFCCGGCFLVWLPFGSWSSQARDQIQATVSALAAAEAMLDLKPTAPTDPLDRPSAAETPPVPVAPQRELQGGYMFCPL